MKTPSLHYVTYTYLNQNWFINERVRKNLTKPQEFSNLSSSHVFFVRCKRNYVLSTNLLVGNNMRHPLFNNPGGLLTLGQISSQLINL